MANPEAFGRKNLAGPNIKRLREQAGLTQRDLTHLLQLAGLDVEKSTLIRMELGSRAVSDLELRALRSILNTTYEALIDG